MLGGGKFWEKFVKAGFRVVLLQMGCIILQWIALIHVGKTRQEERAKDEEYLESISRRADFGE